MRGLGFAAALAICASQGLADETWQTELGRIIYEADVEDQAILSFPTDGGVSLRAYFPGLAGNYQYRNVHHGVWILPGKGDCPTTMTGIDGTTGSNWGRVVIGFDKPEFPTGFTALFGRCLEEPTNTVRAKANKG